ncbi:hypothetical protein KIN20_035508 [Parelaphostrongylus tenuis]|uniref:Uncharacterized protein n=1 Tax=Parelaphostrongylus tenuis TaxID=148309 RepID=A0AAD5RBE2_PARTN|nr:hypothetical protein KIN20_035508 [Parelaphostrongylus tenuis]
MMLKEAENGVDKRDDSERREKDNGLTSKKLNPSAVRLSRWNTVAAVPLIRRLNGAQRSDCMGKVSESSHR